MVSLWSILYCAVENVDKLYYYSKMCDFKLIAWSEVDPEKAWLDDRMVSLWSILYCAVENVDKLYYHSQMCDFKLIAWSEVDPEKAECKSPQLHYKW